MFKFRRLCALAALCFAILAGVVGMVVQSREMWVTFAVVTAMYLALQAHWWTSIRRGRDITDLAWRTFESRNGTWVGR